MKILYKPLFFVIWLVGWFIRLKFVSPRGKVVLGLGALAVASVIYGTLGFMEGKDQPAPLNSWESFFSAVGFLTLNNLDLKAPNSTYLFWGRFLGVLFFLATSLSVLAVCWGEWLMRSILVDHIVIIGAGWRGRRVLDKILELGRMEQIVVVSRTIDDTFKEWCSQHGVATVIGDASEAETLAMARIRHAKRVYIFCGSDDINIHVASMASKACKANRNWRSFEEILVDQKSNLAQVEKASKREFARRIICYVELRSLRSVESLQLATSAPDSFLWPIMMNKEAVTVRWLLERNPFDDFEMHPTASIAHVAVIGNTGMSRELMRQAIQLGHFEHEAEYAAARTRRLVLSVVTPDHERFARGFVEHYPAYYLKSTDSMGCVTLEPIDQWVRDGHILPTVHIYALPVSRAGLVNSETSLETVLFPPSLAQEKQLISVYASLNDGVETLGIAAMLAAQLERLEKERGAVIRLYPHVESRNSTFTAGIQGTLSETPVKIVPFEEFMGDHTLTNLFNEGSELLAIRLNWMYHAIVHQGTFQRFVAANPGQENLTRPNATGELPAYAKKLWLDASEADKDFTRQAAAHGPVKYRIASRLGFLSEPRLSETAISVLGRIEHRRWCADLLLKGFRPLIGKDPKSMSSEEARIAGDLVRGWFGWGVTRTKNRWRHERRHLHLAHFDELPTIIRLAREEDETLTEQRISTELHKDYSQIEMVLPFLRAQQIAEGKG